MNPALVPIPDRLKRFPLWNGFLVHYTVHVREDGTPDFRVIETERQICAAHNHLCHLCGQLLTRPMVFVGGPSCMEFGFFADGPMHEECAIYAIKVCPYLNNPNHGHSKAPLKSNAKIMEDVEIGRPDKMGVLYCDDYHYGQVKGQRFFKARNILRVDWSMIPAKTSDGKPT